MEQYWILVALSWACLVSSQTTTGPSTTSNTTSNSLSNTASITSSNISYTTTTEYITTPHYEDYQVRLVNGETGVDNSFISGRVEVSNDRGETWGTVCDDSFNKSAAIVTCRRLGYIDGEAIAKAYFGSGVGEIFLDEVICQGGERGLKECRTNVWNKHDCDHNEDVGVYCYNDTSKVMKMRLQEGAESQLLKTKWGRLEITLGTMKWGSICDDMFNHGAATIACHYFNYEYGQLLTKVEFKGGERTYLDEVNCRGTEENLLACRHNPWRTHDCGKVEDVGTVCFNSTVRLRSMDLSVRNVGAVQLWKAGDGWMEVCDNGWTTNSAKVTCRELGYVDGLALYGSALAGESFKSPWGDQHPWSSGKTVSSYGSVNCSGTESRLADCPMVQGGRNCPTKKSASVICYNTTLDQIDNTTAVRLVDGDYNWGRVEIRHLGFWGQICEHDWSDREASVICRMKGFAGGKAFGITSKETLPSWLTDITCVGNETSVTDCYLGAWGDSVMACSPAHVLCYHIDVDLRLEDPTGGSGRVDVIYDEINGTICNVDWTEGEATMVCKMMGFTYGRPMETSVTPGTGPVLLSGVQCGLFGADSLFQCDSMGWNKSVEQCADHQNDAGVQCYKDVRLYPGVHSVGVVQIYTGGAWKAVCGRVGFGDDEAKVVCGEIGFANGTALPLGVFGQQYIDTVRPNMSCSSDETSVFNCSYDDSLMASCLPYSISYASVACYNEPSTAPVKYKLEGANIEFEQASGRVRVYSHQTLGYICDKYWDDKDANVLCKELGYNGGIAYKYKGSFPGPFFINEINCVGNETRLEDCPRGLEICNTQQAAGVLCYKTEAPNLQFKPRGGQFGRLEIVINNEAGRICGSKWADYDAEVACTQLGFNDGVALKYPSGSGDVYMSELGCFGNEPSLFRCNNPGWRNIGEECSSEDAGAFCFKDVRVTSGTVNKTMAMGKLSMLVQGKWAPLCADSFDQVDADVACKSLGFTSSKILRTTKATYNPNYVTEVDCNSDATRLTACSYHIGPCSYSVGQARVICFSDTVPTATKYYVRNGYHGRVLVERYGLNGTICEEGWDDNDASVLCKQLGFAGGIAFGTPRNSSFELVWHSGFNCTGDESSLDDCPKNNTVSSKCRNSPTSAGTLCYKSTGVQVRLADGGKNYGRVEISYDGVWGTICDYVWSRYDARALCRQLGYVEGIAYAQSRYGHGSGPVYLDEMRCRIDDKSIYTCPNRGWNNSAGYCNDHDNDAGVYCFPRVRLEPKDEYGAVEVWTGYSYALVCADGFTHTEAKVACRELGFLDGRALCCSAFGKLRKSISIAEVECTGEEGSMMDCSHTKTYPLCDSNRYASVVCTNVTDNSDAYIVKLDNGTTGRVVLRHLNHDGYICPDGFDSNEAGVLCNEMGMSYGGLGYRRINMYRKAIITDLRWMTNVNCTGNEYLLQQCPGANWYNVSTCNSSADAAVFCYRTPGVQKPHFRIMDGTRLEGRVEVNINGTWGSICGRAVDDNVANIICKAMNFPSGSAGIAGSRGQTEGPVWINQLHCSGNESNLFECPLSGLGEEGNSQCNNHLFDAVVSCHTTVRLAGDVNGRTDYGRLEVNINNTWHSVCDGGFSQTAANVACNQLGYNYALRQCCSALGPLYGGRSTNISSISCEGTEPMIENCTIETTGECTDNNYVSVVCSTNVLEENMAISMLNNGFLGMVNVSRYGIWGAICYENWNDTEANASCQQLGYLGGVSIPGTPVAPGMPMLMGKVSCDAGMNFTECSMDQFDEDHGCYDSRKGASALCSNSPEGIQYRLDTDSRDGKGLAQVNINGVWGYISRLDFGDDDASVFCNSVGYVSGQVLWRSVSSSMPGDILVSNVQCLGSEPALHHCNAEWDPERNKYIPASFAVSVTCFKGVRIERGDTKTNGIVKVYNNGVWGTICSNNFDNNDATVVCRELGMTGGLSLCCSPYGFNFDDAVMANVRCTGQEKNIRGCQFDSRARRSLCYRQSYASIACYNGTLSDVISLNLTGGSRYTGQVSVTYAGVTGRVCSDHWSDSDAHVVCKQLGFTLGMAYAHYRSSFSYFDYTGPYWTSEVNCTGDESFLKDCPHIGWGNVSQCGNGHFAGALCLNKEGLYYRLAAGGDQWGRVEVAVDGKWGTICDRYWDRREAKVFCKNLGFDDGDPYYGDFNNTATGPVWETNLRCTGKETTLNDCPHEGWGVATSRACADHKRDAGVFCYTKVKLSTGVGRSITHGGVLWNQGGTWYHVCDNGFNDMSARIVCMNLGFTDGRSICCSAYGVEDFRTGNLLQNMTLRCTGEETSISQCVVQDTCESKMYASVVCADNTQRFASENYTISISKNGKDSGQLAVSHYGVKGRVCSKDWDDEDAEVICKDNGYANGIAYQHSYFGTYATQSTLGPFWLNSINCTGDENNLIDCKHLDRTNLGNCSTKHTASALCYNESGIAYRLAGGGKYYGRAEIRVGGVWGTICDNYWDEREANVFCRQLNYSDGVALSRAHYGEGIGPIWLSHLQCTGKEKSFHQCPHRGYKDLYSTPSFGWPFLLPCTSHRDDASVFCYKTVRLNQKFGVNKGGLEIFDNGERVGVCDTGLNNIAATVACKSLGLNFTHGRVIGGSVFGNITGPIRFTSIVCNGNETDLSECTMRKDGECSTGTYASVYCDKKPFNDTGFAVRLAADGLSQDYHGIMEVRKNGVWGRICMQGWDNNDAKVACRTLGFQGGVAYLHIVKNTNAILMRNFQCTGTEASLANCTRGETPDMENCHYDSNDAGVICYNGTGVRYRLFGGRTNSSGRVEISYDKEWGSVCSWAWSTNNARVFCKSLGLGFKDGLPERNAIQNLPHRNYLLSGAFCNGNEQSLLTCLNSGFNTSLLSYLCTGDAYTSCYKTEIALTEIRLQGGPSPDKGRVEVYIAGPNEWGTVCDDYWDQMDANVVCRMLGWEHGRAVNASAYGKGTGPIWLDNVECIGNETSIGDCKNRGIGTHNCNHSEDASVECYNTTVPSTTKAPQTKSTTPVVVVSSSTSPSPSPTSTSTSIPATSPTTTKTPTTTSTNSATTKPTTTVTTNTSPVPTTSTTTTSITTTPPTTTPSTTTPTTTPPPTTTSTSAPSTQAGTAGHKQRPNAEVVVAIVVPIIILIIIITVVVAIVFWRMRRHQKSGIAHERFHDDIIEQTHDGSIAMRNQLYDMNMANGDTGDPLSDMKYLAEDTEISIEGNGYAHFSKNPSQSADDSGGFSNPLYSVMKDPSSSEPAELQLDADLKDSKT